MNDTGISTLVTRLREGEISRRSFMKQASAIGITAAAAGALVSNVAAQDASPAASPVSGGTASITREDYQAQLREEFDLGEPEQTGGQVIHVNTSDIRTLHPHLVTDVYSGLITDFVFSYLVGSSAIDGTPVPDLADYWEVADDGVTHTFYLNQDATWHDGEPVTADDVIFSFDAMLHEQSLSVRRSTVLDALESYTKIDDHTVQLVGVTPLATFVQDTAGLTGIVAQHIWEDVAVGDFGSDAGATGTDPARVVGSGPFRFVEWVLGDHVTMERNDDYWDDAAIPVIDSFTYRVVGEASTANAELQSGNADISEIDFANADSIRESNPELNIIDYDTTSFNYYYTNQDEAAGTIFMDMAVRQALHYALDHELIAETVYQGYAVRAIGSQPVLSIAYRPDAIETRYDYDPDQARSLLEEAGWAEGDDGIYAKDGQRLSFEILYSEGSATYEQQIPYMQQAWREAGMEMIPAAVPFPTLIDNAIAGQFEMCIAGFSWGVDGGQGDMFRCNAAPPEGFNRMRYCNEEYDELDRQQLAELDQERRIEILLEQSNIVTNEAAAGINVFSKDIMGSSPRLHNFLPNGYSTWWTLPYMWVDQQ